MQKRASSFRSVRSAGVLGLLLLLVGAGCAELQQLAQLRLVDFEIDRVDQAQLAGIPASRLRSYQDLRASDVARIAQAIQSRNLPLEFTLILDANNPTGNAVGRLLRMDWTLYVDDRETVSGVFNQQVSLPAGQTVEIPIAINLELTRFFQENARDMVDLALNIIGAGGAPKELKIIGTPEIQTALGRIRYPQPVTIVRRQVGS